MNTLLRSLIILGCLVAGAAPLAGQDEYGCLECHGQEAEMRELVDSLRASLVVDAERYERSGHAFLDCTGCHYGYEEMPHDPEAESVGCLECHEDVPAQLADSAHHALAESESQDCAACHGVHDVLPPTDRDSRLYPLNVTRTCGQCHFDIDVASASDDQLYEQHYARDSHARGIQRSGLLVSATCVSCHGGHDIRGAHDPESRLSRERVPETCGACHAGLQEKYERSVHHRPQNGDDSMSPSCVDCHWPHEIAPTDQSPFRLGITGVCGSCHQEQSDTFFETVHGKATRLGGQGAAKCQDCHGSHEMLPPADPDSLLSPANISTTCGQCHEGAHPGFVSYLPHASTDDPERWPWMYWSFWGMTSLLVGTMVVALLHTLLFLLRLVLDRKDWQAHHAALAKPGADLRLYRRFDRWVRTQHLLMVVSFITLAVTGMALKFSYTRWAAVIAKALGGLESMSVLHRVAAILLLFVFAWHVRTALVAKKERGLTWLQVVTGPRSILFNLGDLKEIRSTMAWFFGRGPRPAYGRFTYWEKFDYFAVFWGVVIIGSTGIMLWFPVQITHLIPGWMLNVADIIHGDEALLAVAFIFTVHFFNANLRPDKFPMDMTMFTGRMYVEELKYERPAEYDDLVRTGELEKHLVEPLPEPAVHSFRVFASLALLTGIGLIVLIAYALLAG
jgi:cytochrome b subunit of formate dehydrogenase